MEKDSGRPNNVASDEEATRLALSERIRELNCLYALGRLERTSMPLDRILQRSAEIIPPGWQYPEITCARITIEDQEFRSPDFRVTQWKQSRDLFAHGQRAGAVEVYYLEERPARDEGPFLKQERMLIDEIAGHLGGVIERKRAEEERANLARFPSENPSPVLRIAADGTVLYANGAAEPLLSARGSAVGAPAPDEWRELVVDVLASGTRQWFDIEHEGRIFSLSVAPLAGAGYANLYGMDTTERKQAEERLRESEETFRRLFDQSPIGAAVVSLDFRFERVNAAMCDLTGYSEEELASRTFVDITHPDDVEASITNTRRLTAGKIDQFQLEKRYIRKDGRIIWARVSVRAVTDALGRVLYLLPMIQDITDEKRAEYLLENFAESVVENVPAVVVTVDRQGRIQRFNRFAQQLTGYAEEEVRDKDYMETFIRPEDRRHVRSIIEAAAEGRPPSGHENFILAKDGRSILTRWYSSALKDDKGNVIGAVGIGIDMTEIYQKEEQLRRAAKMEAIGRLAGGVAHDFNNYLTTIKGFSSLLMRDLPAADAGRRSVEEIAKASDRAAQLTRQLLAFGRKAIARPQVISLNRVLSDVTNQLKQILGEDIELSVRQEAHLRNIEADHGQLEQVVMNLAINSRDAMPRGGRLIFTTANVDLDAADVREYPGASPGPYVMLAVTDTGAGMDEETLAQVFEPFFTTKSTGESAGLGLATVHGIVKQSGGCIAAESEPGRGTTFKLYFPRVEAPEQVGEEVAPRGPPCKGEGTILVVEDEESVRRFVVRVLCECGYAMLDTASPDEALAIVQNYEKEIHLLIANVVMPGMSGPQLAARLRAARPAMPVLYISGYTADAVAARTALEAGASLLTKPFSPDELCERVRQELEPVQKV